MNSKIKFLIIVLFASLLNEVSGHGMLMDPINRASRWRVDGSSPRDYNDMEGYCGGFAYQWQQYGGKCGLCGDPYGWLTPRAHEYGGIFGSSIVKSYTQGSIITVTAKLTANHRGYFYFKICNLDNELESEACFERYKMYMAVDGAEVYRLPSTQAKDYEVSLKLPSNLYCNHCVLQWTYVAGNNWGVCTNGTGMLGCGPQEHFRSCSDVQINRA